MPTGSEKKKKTHKRAYRPKIGRDPRYNIAALAIVVAGLGIVGYFILFSRAASNNVSAEAESGQLTGNTSVLSDSSASGGKNIQFGQANTGGGGGGGGSATDPILPTISGACPTITNGQVQFPSDSNRVVHIRMDNNASTKGPLVFLWHGSETVDTTDQHADKIANTLLGASTVTNMVNSGAVLAVMKMYAPSTWDNAGGWSTSNRDLNLVDAVTACATKQNLVDAKRIHSLGMSWGGYQTAHLSYLRSNYIASSVVMSGGFTGSPASGAVQRPSNKFATITTLGTVSAGELKMVVAPLQGYRDYAKANGQSVIDCLHSGGHTPIANGGPMHQRFFQDHPYGVTNAYSGALPVPPFVNSCKKF